MTSTTTAALTAAPAIPATALTTVAYEQAAPLTISAALYAVVVVKVPAPAPAPVAPAAPCIVVYHPTTPAPVAPVVKPRASKPAPVVAACSAVEAAPAAEVEQVTTFAWDSDVSGTTAASAAAPAAKGSASKPTTFATADAGRAAKMRGLFAAAIPAPAAAPVAPAKAAKPAAPAASIGASRLDRADCEAMTYRQLQAAAKVAGIRANQKREVLLDLLCGAAR